ncbi:MAG TPA: peptidylprolyl isomerase [Bacteroidetes bacterium]|nr:peptidylprolyl isomerase [Bacteroidota bacterium]
MKTPCSATTPRSTDMNKLILLTLSLLAGTTLSAQKTIDRIVGQVGDKIILQSEVESIYYQEASNGEVADDLRCYILQELVTQKLLLIQAEKDSVVVTDEQVEYELERRLRYYESLFGSRDKMEEFYGKTFQEMKEEFREDIRNILLSDQMKSNIAGDMTVSPSEVKDFFNNIPKDSLPYFDAEVEVAQLTIKPKPTAEQKAYAKQKAEEIHQRLVDGDSFDLLASLYSEDPGSKEDGGSLGCQTRGTFVPEFEAAAFKLQPDEISNVVATQFGYHIIKMDSRQGDKVCLRHILITPPVTNTNVTIATKKLDSIRTQIMAGNISFRDAAAKFSDDEYSKLVGGDMTNPQTGSSLFAIDEMDPELYYAIEKLKPGEVSAIVQFTDYDGSRGLRIVQLKSQSAPHVANLEDDYYRLQAAALNNKQQEALNEWVDQKIKSVYLRVDPIYDGCENMQELIRASYDLGRK